MPASASRITSLAPWQAADPVRVTIVTPPAVEIALEADDLVQQMLRLDGSTDAAYVTHLIAAARKYFEQQTGLALIHQTVKATLDRIPANRHGNLRHLDLPKAPLVSITSVNYIDEDGADQTLTAAAYTAGNIGVDGAFGRVSLKPDYSWPDLGEYPGAFSITFVAGYSAAATAVPEGHRYAILALAAWWYEQRLPVNVGNIVNPVPHHLDALIEQARLAFVA
jgi:uncharacterized phiE125 gp8 family phage protein